MASPQAETYASMIDAALHQHANDLGATVEAVCAQLATLGLDVTPATPAIVEARALILKRLDGEEILHRSSVLQKRLPWYRGPLPGRKRWASLKGRLLGPKKWDAETVDAIDRQSNEIVSLLGNPNEDTFRCRGMVLGYVQSGKTASMTAVISKAVDAGYTTVIVLAGLTDKLRKQTQDRFNDDIVNLDRNAWNWLTSGDPKGDFRMPPGGTFLHSSDRTEIAVVKKNVGPLRSLLRTVKATPPSIKQRLRVLIIDDECDQATVNSTSKELDMTAINQRIRELLHVFPAVTYVGYTATPFANVFIDPYASHTVKKGDLKGQALDDLYPEDFITSLDQPKGYFGAARLFGSLSGDAEEDDDGVDAIRGIAEDDVKQLQPAKMSERDVFLPSMPESLEDALLYFLGCCAARRVRGQGDQHMTMLVHTSAWVAMHRKIAALIEAWIESVSADLCAGTGDAAERFREVWARESGRVMADDEVDPIEADELFDEMDHALRALSVPIENGSSDDRIDYDGAPKTYIAVGGSVLARGLTLEGLMVSYFLRTSRQYDTLMQMGRWFGYRRGYEDLPRIWMTVDLKLSFRALAGVEAEIREDIARYAAEELTPKDLAVRVRAIPGMAITAVNKMRAASRCDVSYWGQHRQTFRFAHRDDVVQKANWQAGAELVGLARKFGKAADSTRQIWRNVPQSAIRRFLSAYVPHSDHKDLSRDLLLGFIEAQGEQLGPWSVAMFEPERGALSAEALGELGPVRTVVRARLTDDETGMPKMADIKALMSARDTLFDCKDEVQSVKGDGWNELKAKREAAIGATPLLLLYAIERHSAPTKANGLRVPLDACRDLLGYGIVFPGGGEAAGEYYSVDLKDLSADELDEIERTEMEQAEAAGVR
ncbi:MAG: hypothetical protein ACJA1L_000081 [Paracoccaceae bacterium]|jgi:hypothetical protein